MKKSILMMLSVITLMAFTVQPAGAQNTVEPWPGVTIKVLTDNENVKVSEITFAPGAVADWHSHPQHVVYAVTDVKMEVEIAGKPTTITEMKAGQAAWSPAVTHKTTNAGKVPFTAIVTEIKMHSH